MFKWIEKHSGHKICIEFEDKTEKYGGFKRYWCYCFDCSERDHFEFFK